MYDVENYSHNVFIESASYWNIIKTFAGLKYFTKVIILILKCDLIKKKLVIRMLKRLILSLISKQMLVYKELSFKSFNSKGIQKALFLLCFKIFCIMFNALIASINLLLIHILKPCLIKLSEDSKCLPFQFLQIRKSLTHLLSLQIR